MEIKQCIPELSIGQRRKLKANKKYTGQMKIDRIKKFKAVFREKFIVLNAYTEKEKKVLNQQSKHPPQVTRKRRANNPKAIRRKEIK